MKLSQNCEAFVDREFYIMLPHHRVTLRVKEVDPPLLAYIPKGVFLMDEAAAAPPPTFLDWRSYTCAVERGVRERG